MNIKGKIKNCIYATIRATKEKEVQPIIVPTDKEQLLGGNVALITGGSSGIGLAIAKAFQSSGAKFIIAGTNQERLEKALSQIGEQAKSIVINVRNVSTLSEKIKSAAELFEENRIDILVNSAGVVTKHEFWNTCEEEYDSIMDTNAKGTFFMSQAVGKQMVEKHIQGHILNVTSSSVF